MKKRNETVITLETKGTVSRLVTRTMMIMTMLMLTISPCFAATNYVQNASKVILANVAWVCVVGTITFAVIAAVKKETAKAVIFIIVGGLLSFIAANPNAVINIGKTLGGAFQFGS